MSGRYIKISEGQKMFIGPLYGTMTKQENAQIDMIDLSNGTPLNETHSAFIEYLAENVKDCPGVPIPFIIEAMLKMGKVRVELA